MRLLATQDYRRVPFILAHVTHRLPLRGAGARDCSNSASAAARSAPSRSRSNTQIREATSGRLVVEATSVQVCYDYEQQDAASTVPDELRERLETFEGRSLARPRRA